MSETLRDRRLRYVRSILGARPISPALIGETSDLEGMRVLVLGTATSETLCALMYTECRFAEAHRPEQRTRPHPADLVLVPHATASTIGRIVEQASTALDRGGRIVIAVPQRDPDFVGQCYSLLLRAGFDSLSLQNYETRTRLCATRAHQPAKPVS